jgi:hypothetical protein
MYARIVRWEGAGAESMKETAARIQQQAEEEGGPPEGVPAKAFMLLTDPDGGNAMAITLFETEEDYRQGDATLSSMNPPGEGMGQRVGVDKYEVAAQFEV